VVELAKHVQRDGVRAIEDPLIRDQLVGLMIKDRIISLNRKRAKIDALNRERPQALWLMEKLSVTEHLKRLTETAVKLQGAKGVLYMGDPLAPESGFWQRSYMNSFSGTIAGGTSEVLRNVIGERLLDLPKA
jgi:alkylation response protein AidB-like acyl-CoA dehydrogenase